LTCIVRADPQKTRRVWKHRTTTTHTKGRVAAFKLGIRGNASRQIGNCRTTLPRYAVSLLRATTTSVSTGRHKLRNRLLKSWIYLQFTGHDCDAEFRPCWTQPYHLITRHSSPPIGYLPSFGTYVPGFSFSGNIDLNIGHPSQRQTTQPNLALLVQEARRCQLMLMRCTYLSSPGSAWAEYQQTGALPDIPLLAGPFECAHDENVSPERGQHCLLR